MRGPSASANCSGRVTRASRLRSAVTSYPKRLRLLLYHSRPAASITFRLPAGTTAGILRRRIFEDLGDVVEGTTPMMDEPPQPGIGEVAFLRVGQPHPAYQPPLPGGEWWSGSRGGAVLMPVWTDPPPHVVDAVRTGLAEFALVDEPPAVWLLYRFGGGQGLPWIQAPFSIHLLPEDRRAGPVFFTGDDQSLPLLVVLVEAKTAVVKALRDLPMSPEFSRTLVRLMEAQGLTPWTGREDYARGLEGVRRRWPSAKAMLSQAVCRMTSVSSESIKG